MMRYLDMPDGAMLRIPHGWDKFTYQGQAYRCDGGLVYVWRAASDGWHPLPMAWIRPARAV